MTLFNSIRDTQEFNPTITGIEIRGVENTPDGKMIVVFVKETEITPNSKTTRESIKYFPLSYKSVITGLDIENNNEPEFDIEALKTIFNANNITIVSKID